MTKNTNGKISVNLSVAILIGSFVIAIAIIINALLSYLKTQNPKPTDPKEVFTNIGYVKIKDSPILGDNNAPVTVIEYTDFDCPICNA